MKTLKHAVRKSEPLRLRATEDVANLVDNAMSLEGYTANRLADEAGVCQQTVSRLIERTTKFPRLDTVIKILAALNYEIIVSGVGEKRSLKARDLS